MLCKNSLSRTCVLCLERNKHPTSSFAIARTYYVKIRLSCFCFFVFGSFLVADGCCIHIDEFFFLAAGRRTRSTARAGMEAQAQWQCRHLEGVSCHLYGGPQNGTASSFNSFSWRSSQRSCIQTFVIIFMVLHSCPMVTPNLCLDFSRFWSETGSLNWPWLSNGFHGHLIMYTNFFVHEEISNYVSKCGLSTRFSSGRWLP